MNILLLNKKDINKDGTALLKGEKAVHIKKVLKLKTGDRIKSGTINGKTGTSIILDIKESGITIKPEHINEPPPPLDLHLIIALPRPKVARRVIYTAATLGIKKIHLINSLRVEKSYWQSPHIDEKEVKRQLISGLEQGFDTILPRVIRKKYFKPFVEDELPEILKKNKGYLLHPYSEIKFPKQPEKTPSAIIIGPEGGFIPYENEKIISAGALPCNMGKRIMRVETSVTAAISPFL